MTTKINTLQQALTAIAETAYKINGSTVLTSEHCAALTGAFYNSQQREDALTKTRDEALRDLAECTAQLRDTSKQLDESIAASMTSSQERAELECRIAEMGKTLEHYSSMINAERARGDAISADRNDLHAKIDALEESNGGLVIQHIKDLYITEQLDRDLAAARKALVEIKSYCVEQSEDHELSEQGFRHRFAFLAIEVSCLQLEAARAAQSDGGKEVAK